MSRLLATIDAELRAATTPAALVNPLTRKAIYLARDGKFVSSREQIAKLRAIRTPEQYGNSTAGANLAEAVVATYSGNFREGVDKLRRAAAIVGTSQPGWLGRLIWAWQAHAYQLLLRPEGVSGIAQQVLASASPDEHDVLSRLCSVVAVGMHISGSYESARPWYEAARIHAVAEGDELTIDAYLYNVAAYRIHNARLAEPNSSLDPSEIERAKWEIQSSENFDRITSGTSFLWSLPLYSARAVLLDGDTQRALTMFSQWSSTYSETVPPEQFAAAEADRAYCLAASGDAYGGRTLIDVVLDSIPIETTDDEIALIYFRASQISQMVGDADSASKHLSRSRDRLARFQQLQRIWSNALKELRLPEPVVSQVRH